MTTELNQQHSLVSVLLRVSLLFIWMIQNSSLKSVGKGNGAFRNSKQPNSQCYDIILYCYMIWYVLMWYDTDMILFLIMCLETSNHQISIGGSLTNFCCQATAPNWGWWLHAARSASVAASSSSTAQPMAKLGDPWSQNIDWLHRLQIGLPCLLIVS